MLTLTQFRGSPLLAEERYLRVLVLVTGRWDGVVRQAP
jgi:hypothetical protein